MHSGCQYPFYIWLWISLVKRARKLEGDRLGVSIFRILQIVFLIVTVIISLPSIRSIDEFNILLIFALVFDVAIVWLAVHFLFLAWLARCKIPFHSYWEIGSIFAMIILQVILLKI